MCAVCYQPFKFGFPGWNYRTLSFGFIIDILLSCSFPHTIVMCGWTELLYPRLPDKQPLLLLSPTREVFTARIGHQCPTYSTLIHNYWYMKKGVRAAPAASWFLKLKMAVHLQRSAELVTTFHVAILLAGVMQHCFLLSETRRTQLVDTLTFNF